MLQVSHEQVSGGCRGLSKFGHRPEGSHDPDVVPNIAHTAGPGRRKGERIWLPTNHPEKGLPIPNVPVRPPAEPWIEAPSQENPERALEILGTATHVIPPGAVTVDASGHDDLMGAMIGIVERRPMSEKQLAETLGKWTGSEPTQALHQLDTFGKVQSVIRGGERFWAIPNPHYAETRPAFGTGRGNPKR